MVLWFQCKYKNGDDDISEPGALVHDCTFLYRPDLFLCRQPSVSWLHQNTQCWNVQYFPIYILCKCDELAIVLKIDWDKELSDHSKGTFEIAMLVTYAILDLNDKTLQCAISVPFFICAIFSVPFRKNTHTILTEFWQTKTSVVIFCKLIWTFFPPSSNVAHILTTSFHLIFKGRHNVKSHKKATLLFVWFSIVFFVNFPGKKGFSG